VLEVRAGADGSTTPATHESAYESAGSPSDGSERGRLPAVPGATALAGRLRLREVRDRWRTLQIGDAAAGAEVLLLPPRDVRHSRHGRAPDQDPTPHVVLGGVLGCDPDAWRRRAGDAEQARHGALRDRVSTPVQAASR
jgi:hypothetical protein